MCIYIYMLFRILVGNESWYADSNGEFATSTSIVRRKRLIKGEYKFKKACELLMTTLK